MVVFDQAMKWCSFLFGCRVTSHSTTETAMSSIAASSLTYSAKLYSSVEYRRHASQMASAHSTKYAMSPFTWGRTGAQVCHYSVTTFQTNYA